ncbi:uncharacterized protein AMSG_05895 [Thecamonas trahens ATCC 50062]|uniref:Isopenicillin N synthase-like Fe(2+) 2OG dioxygenase domain-containing protein n=1 Tax=Thecamonas trahens ATCC 50062 TaxID=461836 RepID=A0A0L0DFP5_THETB|nr:hypothetical protein AMSG_05895 [Thecamonas trahens ATCC 50062]KNC50123.1 hypothetical protein AMSG_05895 [Thecamonas trahens ATCC 50062]|eukprot:XP_013757282.1 hypothetical protein AMSG_05895 [Thecamonas trahens ATCC 50062]
MATITFSLAYVATSVSTPADATLVVPMSVIAEAAESAADDNILDAALEELLLGMIDGVDSGSSIAGFTDKVAYPIVYPLSLLGWEQRVLDAMMARGFALIELDDEFADVMRNAAAAADAFFSLPLREKFKCARDEMIEGYGFINRGREVYNVQERFVELDGSDFASSSAGSVSSSGSDSDESDVLGVQRDPWPRSLGTDFRETIEGALTRLKALARECLGGVGSATGLDEDRLDALVHVPPVVDEVYGFRTTLRLLKYYQGVPFDNERAEDGSSDDDLWDPEMFAFTRGDARCIEHGDSTLLTVAPVSAVAELQVVDRATGRWANVEALHPPAADHARYAVVFPGYYGAWLTNGTLAASLHRVESCAASADRVSMPFFLRVEPRVPVHPIPVSGPPRTSANEAYILNQCSVVPQFATWLTRYPLWTKFKPPSATTSDTPAASDPTVA